MHRTLAALLVLLAVAHGQDPSPVEQEQKRNEDLAQELQELKERAATLQKTIQARAAQRAAAKSRWENLEKAYAEGGLAAPTEDKVLQMIRELEDQTARSAVLARLDELDRRRARYEGIREESARWLVDLESEFKTLRGKTEGDWEAVESRRRDLLTRRRQDAANLVKAVTELKDHENRLNEIRRSTLYLLRRENLFLRGRSDITGEALAEGFADLKDLPGWLATTAGSVGSYISAPRARGGLLRLAGVAAAVFVLLFLAARWTGKRGGPDGFKAHAYAFAARVLRALAIASVLLLVPLLASRMLPGLGAGVRHWLRIVGYTLGGFWAAQTVYRELFLPRPPADEPIVRLDPAARRALGLGIRILVYLSVVAVPVLYGLELLGYSNKGMIEFGWLVYETLLAAIVLILLLRRSLIESMLPSTDSGTGRLVAFLVRYLRPLALLLVPATLVFDALRYDILAGMLTRYAVAAVVVLIGGSLVYRLVVYVADLAVSAAYAKDKPALAAKRAAASDGLLFVLRVVFFFVALGVFLRLSGSDMTELRAWLDAHLPLTTVTYWSVLVGLFYLVLFLVGTRHAKAVLQELVLDRTKLDKGVQYTITTLVGYLLVFAGFYFGITQVVDLSNIGYIFAALSVGIGFGLQEIVSNFVSGLILLFERPLKVGDLIQVGTNEGIVKQINIRATTVLTRDNVYLLVPNREFIAQTVVNFRHKDPKIRIHVGVGVSYGSDTRLVEKVLLEVAAEHPDVLKRPEPEVWFTTFGNSSLDFEMLVWIYDPPARNRISSELSFAIFDKFNEHGIEIPFPQRDLHLKSGPWAKLGQAEQAPETDD